MKKSTKGALAASAAALLLLGGLGTQASWTDGQSIDKAGIQSGRLALVDPACLKWELKADANDLTATELTPDALQENLLPEKLAPGNILTRVCTFTVSAEGHGIKANLQLAAPTVSGENALATLLRNGNVTAEYHRGTDAISSGAAVDNGDTIKATIKVVLPTAAENATQNLAATLDAITVTVKTPTNPA
ncbi:alternate-type signal peptide domain-containing protein [Nocardioides sp. GCM10027113]|uniref:alternate-type signal peptide domain-containing protein n=1 Tax=unclassified Nocardioides TaxID=2615069 RepID=UPI003615E90E